MAKFGSSAPASFWRAFFILVVAASRLFSATPTTAPTSLAQIGKPDAAEARNILDQFRRSGITGEYYLEFELHQLPRRGDEQIFPGKLWGGRNTRGTIARIVLTDGQGKEQRLLVQNGDASAVWSFRDGKLTQPDVAALLQPLVPGVELTAFDLEMPYLSWPDAEVTAIVRILGRPAHAFFFKPPAAFASQHAEPAAVRAYFDAQFNAPTQTEWLDARGAVAKTLSLIEIKRLGGQPLPKILEVRNETTRDKTRFVITGAALGLNLAAGVFEPAALGDDLRPPAADRIVRIAP